MGFLQTIRSNFLSKAKVAETPIKFDDDIERSSRLIEEGNILEDTGNFQEALQLYNLAITAAPQYARAHINKGNNLKAMGAIDEAISSYSRALSIEPNNAKIYFNIGNTWQRSKQYERALKAYEKALELDPEFSDAWLANGNNFGDMGKTAQAIDSYSQSLIISPNYFQAHRNIASVYYTTGEFRKAKNHVERAIEIQPESIESHIELSNILLSSGDVGNAISAARTAASAAPHSAPAHSLLLFCLMHSPEVSRTDLTKSHLDFGKQFDQPRVTEKISPIDGNSALRALQVGIVSPDLYAHSVASFFSPIYSYLSKNPAFEFHIYYTGEIGDVVTQKLKKQSAHWVESGNLTDEELEKKIQSDKIDILIDLSGHTNGHRLNVFGRKPAPLQMSWIGYPCTTGMKTMDYYVGDRHFLPPEKYDDMFSEKIIRLPATAPFHPFEEIPEVNELPALNNGYIVFGSFNRMDKINRNVVELWSKLLHTVSNAKLLMGGLPAESELTELLSWFSSCGIERSRLVLHARSDMHRYLRLHHDVDVCLDTFPYGGSTTTSHALTMGVPTLTLAGETPISNAGRSILSQVGIEPLFAATTEEDFVFKGVWCAQNISELSELRATLRQRTLASNLMRPEAIANAFALAVRHAWQRHCEGFPPETFETIERDGKFEVSPG